MNNPDFRALCAELLSLLDNLAMRDPEMDGGLLRRRARAALAQLDPPLPANYIDPEHQGEDLELLQTFYRACQAEGGTADEIHLRGVRAVLAARPAIQPVPVSERLPGPKDWDVCGMCWMFDPCVDGWWGYRSALPSDDELGRPPWTHWLPHWALPIPTPTP